MKFLLKHFYKFICKLSTTRGQEKSFELSFWLINRRYAFMKIFAIKFFVANRILTERNTTGGRKTFRIQFLVDKSKSMHFNEKFRWENICRKLNFKQICYHQGSDKTFQISFFVNKSKYMLFYEKFRKQIFCRKLIFEQM